ncbi:MAG: COGs COG2343, partial [uncultured Acetobacteraceae bacterium]
GSPGVEPPDRGQPRPAPRSRRGRRTGHRRNDAGAQPARGVLPRGALHPARGREDGSPPPEQPTHALPLQGRRVLLQPRPSLRHSRGRGLELREALPRRVGNRRPLGLLPEPRGRHRGRL